jgi:hypothetical protein
MMVRRLLGRMSNAGSGSKKTLNKMMDDGGGSRR